MSLVYLLAALVSAFGLGVWLMAVLVAGDTPRPRIAGFCLT